MSQTIGQRLKQEREARFLSLERAAQETRIRKVFLQALETDDFSVMPSAAQGRGFLRNYAEYLGINIDELIADLQRNPLGLIEEVSGPLPQVNLAETELPPLTQTQDEDPAPPLLGRALKRKPKKGAATENDSPLPAHIEALLTEAAPPEENPKPRGRKKKAIEESTEAVSAPAIEEQPQTLILPVEREPTLFKKEALPALWGKIKFFVQEKLQKPVQTPVVITPSTEREQNPPQITSEKPADLIMAEIGLILRKRRELISLTVDEVERHTHLRAVFVKALEEGAFDKLPSTVQTRGMLSNYASFLDLDVDTILLRYADALQARRREKYSETPREKIQTQVTPTMPMLRTFMAGDIAFGLMMVVVLVALAIWGLGRIVTLQEEASLEPTLPSVVDVLGNAALPTASAELTFVAVDDPAINGALGTPEPLTTPEVQVSTANVSVNLFALERVYVKISVDGELAFEGRLAPRENKLFEADDQVVILTGDGSALRVTYNGTDLGLMGASGEVVNRVYLISGVATPTATIPPTVTNTPATTPTFTPTATGTPGSVP